MSKVTSVFCFAFLCVMGASAVTDRRAKVIIPFSTLRSDLELILADPDKQPTTVQIEYSKGAILHVSLLTDPFSPSEENYIEINTEISIKDKDVFIEGVADLVFRDGSFAYKNNYGRKIFKTPSEQEKTTHIVLRKQTRQTPRSAPTKTISYISTTLLKDKLNIRRNEMKKKSIPSNDTGEEILSLGSFSTSLTYNYETKFLLLKNPLIGISLNRVEIQPDIFWDVWYRPSKKLFGSSLGSSSRSFEGIDAVRVYNEWFRHEEEAQTNVRAIEDPHNSGFVPSTSRERSSDLRDTGLEKLISRLKAVQAAVQIGCDYNGQVYNFSILYGVSFRVSVHCNTGNIVMKHDGRFKMRAVSKSGETVIKECHYLRYTNEQDIEIRCTEDKTSHIAITEEPRPLWLNDGSPTLINSELLTAEMKLLKDNLIENRQSRKSTPTIGTSTLDANMLFKINLPNGRKHPTDVEVCARFKVSSPNVLFPEKTVDFYCNKLNFQGERLAAYRDTSSIILQGTPSSLHYDSLSSLKRSYIIGSAYLTTKQLQENLKIASESASIRCRTRENHSYLIKLVHLNQFELDGLYECSQQVFLFKNKFKALILSKTGQDAEILTERRITHFIYAVKDKLFIPEKESFDDVYAIQLPKMKEDLEETLRLFGTPQMEKLPRHTIILFKSKEL